MGTELALFDEAFFAGSVVALLGWAVFAVAEARQGRPVL